MVSRSRLAPAAVISNCSIADCSVMGEQYSSNLSCECYGLQTNGMLVELSAFMAEPCPHTDDTVGIRSTDCTIHLGK